MENRMLEGKLALVFGVANRRSIAWGIAQALAGAGARIIFTCQDRVEDTVRELASTLPDSAVHVCDVQNDEQTDAFFQKIAAEEAGVDILIHSIAFAPREALDEPFIKTSRDSFRTAMDISAYSLVQLARAAEPLMEKRGGGSIVAMTYYGSDKVFPKYNVMGVCKAALESSVRYLASDLGQKNIRVNAISAGPVRTLAARSISGFTRMEEHVREVAPLRRNTEAAEVGDVALFLCSHLARGVTGEVLFCDNGYNIMGM